MTDAIWANPAAHKKLAKMLKGKSLPASGTTKSFGNLSDTTNNQHKDYVNFRAFTDGGSYGNYYGAYYGYYGYWSDVMDDLTAALGRFVFHTVVAGDVTATAPSRGAPTHQVTICAVGIYARDTYDFNGSQPLGFWDDSDNSVSMLNFLSGTHVSNESFRDWRTANHKGGDFEIFTDLRRIVLPKPASFIIT